MICAALVFAAAVTVAQPLWIADDAMAPTLEAGTLVLYSSWNYAPARGDVVVSTVESPEGGMLVRRIIGLPGDRVSLDRTTGQVTVNGQPLAEDYVSCRVYCKGCFVVRRGDCPPMGQNPQLT